MTNSPESDTMKTLLQTAKENGASSHIADVEITDHVIINEAQLLATFNAWSAQQEQPLVDFINSQKPLDSETQALINANRWELYDAEPASMNDNHMKQAEREAFEAWYEDDAMPAESNWFKRDADGDYVIDHVDTSWYAWQARAKLTTSQVSEPACSICNDSGQYCTGTSGDESDGNAPILERCDCEAGQPTTTPQEAISPAIKKHY
jgi:hypothetical protein